MRMRTRVLGTVVVVASLALSASAAQAAVDMYFVVPDQTGQPAIIGESVAVGHADQIDVLAWSSGVSKAASPTGRRLRRLAPLFKDLSFTKYLDSSSPAILQAVATGTTFGSAKLQIFRAGSETPVEFVRVVLRRRPVYVPVRSRAAAARTADQRHLVQLPRRSSRSCRRRLQSAPGQAHLRQAGISSRPCRLPRPPAPEQCGSLRSAAAFTVTIPNSSAVAAPSPGRFHVPGVRGGLRPPRFPCRAHVFQRRSGTGRSSLSQ